MNTKQLAAWISRALPSKTDSVSDYMRAPFAVGSVTFATDGFRAHVAAGIDAPPAGDGDRAEKAAESFSRMILDARKGYRITLPAGLLREVSGVMGKERKHRANILRITLSPDAVQFERPGTEIEISATVSKADGYNVNGSQPLPADGLSFSVNPGYLYDAVSAVPKRKQTAKQMAKQKVTISVATPRKPIVIDYDKLTAVIQPMNASER